MPSQHLISKVCKTTIRCNVGGCKWDPTSFSLRQIKRKFVHTRTTESSYVNATSEPLESQPEAVNYTNWWKSSIASLDAFYRFSRPHTVIGTVKAEFYYIDCVMHTVCIYMHYCSILFIIAHKNHFSDRY